MAKECAHYCFIRISLRTSMTTRFDTGLLIFATVQQEHPEHHVGNEFLTTPTTENLSVFKWSRLPPFP
ncbi:hypothetical protein P692DRAFT_20837425 [Suillus brevipes Sb2]|nr:hypothetical protein P692DRAFT_20837425 [Suillus brevipes Sb2]